MRTNSLKHILQLLTAVILTLGLSISAQSLIAAWQVPSAAPPNSNITAPLNTGPQNQQKQGMLWINTAGNTNGLIVQSGNVGIGTTNPQAKLDVNGNITQGCNTHYIAGSLLGDWCDGILHIQSGGSNVNFDGNDNVNITNGNFNINTQTPGATLNITGGSGGERLGMGSWTVGGIQIYSTCTNCGDAYGAIGGNSDNGSIQLYPRSGTLIVKGNTYSSALIDINDGNYYIDPNGNSRLNATYSNYNYSYGDMRTNNLISGGSNSWIFHTPDDGRTTLYVAPGTNDGNWNWGGGVEFWNNGTIKANGDVCNGTGKCLSAIGNSSETLQSVTSRGNTTNQWLAMTGFSDSNDGNYYVDPNGTTRLNILNTTALTVLSSNMNIAGGGDTTYNIHGWQAFGSYDGWDPNRLYINGYGNFSSGTTIAGAGGLHVDNNFDVNGSVGIGASPGGYKLYVADQGKDVVFDVNNLHVVNPEGTNNWVRLGSAWNKPGVYSNGNLYLSSESQVVINDNNQDNWIFDGDNLISNGWGHIYSNSDNLHIDSGNQLFLNYYNNHWVTVGNQDSGNGYLRIGDTQIYDDNDWLRIYSGANNRIYTNSYFRIDNTLEINGNILANGGNGLLYWAGGEGETLRLTGNNGVNMHLENINGKFRLVNSPWTAEIFNVDQSGNTWTAGNLTATGDVCNGTGKCLSALGNSNETLQSVTARGNTTNQWLAMTGFSDSNDGNYYSDPNGTSRLNTLNIAGNLTANESYTNGWFRANGGGGLYSQAYDMYLWPVDGNSNYWGSRSNYGWKYQDRGGNIRGYTYFDGGGFGLLSSDGNWRMRTQPGYQELYGVTYLSDARSSIYYDRDDTNYYSDPNGTSRLNYTINNNVYAYGWMQASWYPDADNNNYKLDPDGTSQLNSVNANSLNSYGGITMGSGGTLYSSGRMHIGGEELLYILNKSGLIVSKAWGGNGNLTVEGNINASGNIQTGGNITSNTVNATKFCLNGNCITSWPSGGGGGNTYIKEGTFTCLPGDTPISYRTEKVSCQDSKCSSFGCTTGEHGWSPTGNWVETCGCQDCWTLEVIGASAKPFVTCQPN